MRLVLSDTALPAGLPVREDWHYVDLSQLKIADCMGCFSCWVRTPGRCVIRDDAVGVYPLIAHSDHVIYVSRLFCGSYDVPMKTMLERAIPVQQQFFGLHHGKPTMYNGHVASQKSHLDRLWRTQCMMKKKYSNNWYSGIDTICPSKQ